MKRLPIATLTSTTPLTVPFRYPKSHFTSLLPAIATWFHPTGHLNTPHFSHHPASALVTVEHTTSTSFTRRDLPLHLFLTYLSAPAPFPWGSLYLAQCPLPASLSPDLPTPPELPRRNTYACNLWLSRASETTNTPLHRDPNPNLFVMLAGRKAMRLVEPQVGARLVRGGRRLSEEDMLGGMEADEVVWAGGVEGYEVEVEKGDAVFVPEGWWHAVRSRKGEGVTGSVNWWFRR